MNKIQFLHQGQPKTDEDIIDLKKEFDLNFLIFIRALEYNKTFEEWLHKMRKQDEIPEDGYGFESKSKNENKGDIKYTYAFEEKDLQYIIDRLPLKYKYYLNEDDWKNIVLWNCVDIRMLDDDNFFITPVQPDIEYADNHAFLLQFKQRFNKKELHDFIDREWNWIERYLPDPDNEEEEKNRLSEKDIFLLHERDDLKKPFDDIALNYPNKFKKRNTFYYQDNIKSAHSRAKHKVEKLLDIKHKYPHKISSMFDYYKKTEK